NGENRGGQVPDQIGHDPDGDGGSSEALVAELDDPASSVTVTVSNLYNTEDQGEYGQVTLFNSQGEVLGKVLFGSAPEEDFADYEGVYQQVDFDGGTNVGTIDLKASDFCEGEAIGSLAFEAVPYGGAETGGIETGDSSDYFVREIDYTKASIEGWTFPEDGAELSSAHGAEGDGENLVIPVKLVAATQDNDGSEGITRMTLRNRGEGQEARVWQVKDAEAEGNIVESPSEWVLINVPGKDGGEGGQGLARLADDGDLVLNFGRNALKVAETQENDAWIDIFEQAPGPESVDLSGVVSLKLPIDDSNDFEVNATTQTTEYDDDAFSNLDDRILEENWREICEGDCGDKTADQFVSQQFNVSGVVAEAE
ncbi:hypothetical protein, partial [Fodinicurvata sediminis]|uniref:hypothetical protein n=1 Tax=Fodinicurvata sediminis TaxID=1121832 RepID=UPI00059057B5